MKEQRNLINELQSNIPYQKLIKPSVSKPSVVWHIEHSLLSVKLMIDKLEPCNFINHPYFGHMNLNSTKKLLMIHTDHHLKII